MLDSIFDEANASAYHVIASWLDFKEHTHLASIVADRFAPTLDGHGTLYQWCMEQTYWRVDEWRWQEQLNEEFDNLSCPHTVPADPELYDWCQGVM